MGRSRAARFASERRPAPLVLHVQAVLGQKGRVALTSVGKKATPNLVFRYGRNCFVNGLLDGEKAVLDLEAVRPILYFLSCGLTGFPSFVS